MPKRPIYHKRTHCRACDAPSLHRFLALGPQPLANSFLKDESQIASEQRFPLDVVICQDCGLVQIDDVIDPETLFRDYIYVTGTSSTIAAHNIDYAQTVQELLGLGKDDLVVEIASNDGSLLKCFKQLGINILGVEPATNIATMAEASGIDTLNVFFGSATAPQVAQQKGKAKAVIGNNELAHVDDTRDFLSGCASLLAPGGLVITEVPYLREFAERYEYDTVYHEHLCYFSVSALLKLTEAAGLRIRRVDRVPVHGGSIRMYAGLASEGGHAPQVLAMAEEERLLGLTSVEHFDNFGRAVRESRDQLRTLLTEMKKQGLRVAGYGAPAKGNTLLNYCGITTELLPYTVDRSPLKVGLLTPGTYIPVKEVDTLIQDQPDYVLILAWNFAAEIIQQQQAYAQAGGRFIVPIPAPMILDGQGNTVRPPNLYSLQVINP